jgi:hypothetical protein
VDAINGGCNVERACIDSAVKLTESGEFGFALVFATRDEMAEMPVDGCFLRIQGATLTTET